MIEAVGVCVSILVAAFGGLSWLKKNRENALRRAEVFDWANAVIECLQSLVVYLNDTNEVFSEEEKKSAVAEIAIKTSVLVEQGRLFFRNCVVDDFGKEKERAYRGYRPLILDYIVVSHQIACRWHRVDKAKRPALLAVAEDMTRSFVSLIQLEVGRSRTAEADTSVGGSGANLDYLLNLLPPKRAERECPVPH